MTTRYWEETPCETCSGIGWIPDDPEGWNVPDMSMSGCPDCQPGIGGTGVRQRRELTGVETILLDSSGRQPKQWCVKHDCEGLGNNDDLVGCTGAGVGVLADMDCRLVTVAIIPLEEPADG